MGEFQRGLGVGGQVKARYHNVVAEYVPASFEPENTYVRAKVESDNAFDSGSLVGARWIKPRDKRAPG